MQINILKEFDRRLELVNDEAGGTVPAHPLELLLELPVLDDQLLGQELVVVHLDDGLLHQWRLAVAGFRNLKMLTLSHLKRGCNHGTRKIKGATVN